MPETKDLAFVLHVKQSSSRGGDIVHNNTCINNTAGQYTQLIVLFFTVLYRWSYLTAITRQCLKPNQDCPGRLLCMTILTHAHTAVTQLTWLIELAVQEASPVPRDARKKVAGSKRTGAMAKPAAVVHSTNPETTTLISSQHTGNMLHTSIPTIVSISNIGLQMWAITGRAVYANATSKDFYN